MLAKLVTEIEELEELGEPWRELAHACACPGALPGWQLAWWRNLAPAGAVLRTVAVLDADRLVGLAPFFTVPSGRVDYRLLGAGETHRLTLLALPEVREETARLVAQTLAQAEPAPDLVAFEGIDGTAEWPGAVAGSWPGRLRPWRYVSSTHPAPVVELGSGGYEEWFQGRSGNFRQQMRRARRALEGRGGRTALAQAGDEAARAIDAFARLHSTRWEPRGGSSLGEPAFAMLAEAAQALVPTGEMRIWTVELDGRAAAVQVYLAAGRELQYFNGGFDESVPEVRPALLAMLAAVEDAFARGDRRLDLGVGAQDYKLRFATADAPIAWRGLVPRTPRYVLTRARLLPAQAAWLRGWAGRRLPPARKAQLKRLLRRGRPSGRTA